MHMSSPTNMLGCRRNESCCVGRNEGTYFRLCQTWSASYDIGIRASPRRGCRGTKGLTGCSKLSLRVLPGSQCSTHCISYQSELSPKILGACILVSLRT